MCIRDSFFDLGGHSLLATQMLARIEYDYGIELPLRPLFDGPAPEQLAARVASECEAADRAAMAALLGDIDNLSEAELLDRLSDAGVTGAA